MSLDLSIDDFLESTPTRTSELKNESTIISPEDKDKTSFSIEEYITELSSKCEKNMTNIKSPKKILDENIVFPTIHNYNFITNHNFNIKQLKTFKQIHDYINENGKIFVFMGEGQHKIKRKAEQIACNEALTFITLNSCDNDE